MQGEFQRVWSEMWLNVWLPIQTPNEDLPADINKCLERLPFPEDYKFHDDLFSYLFVEASRVFTENIKESQFSELSSIANDPSLAANRFQRIRREDFLSEGSVVDFLEKAYDTLSEFDDLLANRYKFLIKHFISKYGLRYELASPFSICPTLPGVFSSLFSEISRIAERDEHLKSLTQDFLISFRSVRSGATEDRIRNCVHKLIVLTEGVAAYGINEEGVSLGESCNKIKRWPHPTVGASLSKLYGFASDYPGIRHSGKPSSKRRELDARDLIAISAILYGYAPYLADGDWDNVYLSRRTLADEWNRT